MQIIVKIGILYRNEQFNEAEIKIAQELRQQFNSIAMTIVSFHQVEFSYDRAFLVKQLNKCKSLVIDLVSRHLTDKSLGRVENVFNFFTSPQVLDDFFKVKDGELGELRGIIIRDISKLLENGDLWKWKSVYSL